MKILKIILLLGLVFGAGVIVGVGGTRWTVQRIIEQATNRPDVMTARLEREVTRELKLTPEQRPKVHEIMRRRHEELQQLRGEFQPRLAVILKRGAREIRDVLDDTQRQKFDALLKTKPFLPPALAKPAAANGKL